MNIKDLDKELEKILYCIYGEDSNDPDWTNKKQVKLKLSFVIKDLLSQSNQEIVKERYTKKELLNFLNWVSKQEDSLNYFIKTRGLKDLEPYIEQQRQKLTQLRQSNNLLGEKK